MNLEQLVAQQEIRDVLIRYTRGIDRMDVDLVRSTYHPDVLQGRRNRTDPVYER